MSEAILTAVAAALALSQPVPQIARLLRTRSIAGVSGPTAWLGLAINAGWIAYGIGRGLLSVTVISVAYVTGYLTIVLLLLRGGNRRGIGSGILAGAACVAIAATLGWTVLGTALALSVGVQFVPQVVHAWRSEDLTALSPGTYAVCGLDGIVWGSIGLLHADGPLILYGAIMATVAVLVIVPQRRWAARMRAATA